MSVIARLVLAREAKAILRAARRLDERFDRCVHLLDTCEGKVVVSGIGKSGLVGQKIAATFCSVGMPAVFLHPTEALHGDLGVMSPGDVAILISNSGSTPELLKLVPLMKSRGATIVGICGSPLGELAQKVDIVLDAHVDREADNLNLVPTASTSVAMALGDALAIALMQHRRVTSDEFGTYHPSGQLGRNLKLRVRDVMHAKSEIAWASAEQPLREIVILITRSALGAACVVDPDYRLMGLITDGDLRRALERHEDIRPLVARDVMTVHPIAINPDVSLRQALDIMENRPSQISVLPVVEDDGKCVGLIRIHDIYR